LTLIVVLRHITRPRLGTKYFFSDYEYDLSTAETGPFSTFDIKLDLPKDDKLCDLIKRTGLYPGGLEITEVLNGVVTTGLWSPYSHQGESGIECDITWELDDLGKPVRRKSKMKFTMSRFKKIGEYKLEEAND